MPHLEVPSATTPVAAHHVVAVTGNPRAGSRTAALARYVAEQIAGTVRELADADPVAIDLADPPAATAEHVALLCGATLAVIASPTYKGTYSGLLKTLLDAVPHDGLAGVIAVPLMVAGDRGHALAVELHLRPVLVELGAITPTRGLFFEERDLPDPAGVLDPWLARSRPALEALVAAGLRS